MGVSRPTVNLWRNRYAESGVQGLQDELKPGRPRTVDRNTILTTTLMPPPKRLGVTQWSSRLLADELKVAQNTVLRTWRHYRVQPWRSETFKFSTDPELVAKVTDVVGLYLAPPENAIVLCVDESFASTCAKLAGRITGCWIPPRTDPSFGRRLELRTDGLTREGVWRPWNGGPYRRPHDQHPESPGMLTRSLTTLADAFAADMGLAGPARTWQWTSAFQRKV